MIVCVCEGISERSVREVVRAGARSLDEVAAACGAGTKCGSCHLSLRRLVCLAMDETSCASRSAAGSWSMVGRSMLETSG